MDDLTRRLIDWAKGRSLSHPYIGIQVEDRWSERRTRCATTGEDPQVVARYQEVATRIVLDKNRPYLFEGYEDLEAILRLRSPEGVRLRYTAALCSACIVVYLVINRKGTNVAFPIDAYWPGADLTTGAALVDQCKWLERLSRAVLGDAVLAFDDFEMYSRLDPHYDSKSLSFVLD